LVFQFISFSCAIHALLCLCAYANAKKQGIAEQLEPGQGGNYPSAPPLLILAEKEAQSTRKNPVLYTVVF